MAQISVGKILTYKKLAIAMGDEISIRAAGTTLNHNPFPIKIPRHRIIDMLQNNFFTFKN